MKRKPLTKQRIVGAALRLVGRTGLDGFGMRKLGKALGVEAMSLYHHFPSQAHLFDAAMDSLIASCPHPQELKGTPEERLRETMRGYRDMARRHPRFFPWIVQHRFNTEATLRFMEQLLALFVECGNLIPQSVDLFRVAGYFLAGCGLEENMSLGGAAEPVPLEEQRLRFPLVYEAAPYFAGRRDEAFELGLELLAGSVDPAVRRRLVAASRPPPPGRR